MTAYNVVRMRVKPEHGGEVLSYYRERPLDMPGRDLGGGLGVTDPVSGEALVERRT